MVWCGQLGGHPHHTKGVEKSTATVVVGDLGRIQFLVLVAAAVDAQETLGVFVGAPDGGQAGGPGGHDVDAVAIVGTHAGDTGADKLHNAVLHIAALEHRADDIVV